MGDCLGILRVVNAASLSHEAEDEKRERRCVHDTKYSQAVSHPSTNFAQPGLTAVIGREPVLSWWCGRERLPFEKTTISIKTTVSLPKHEAEA